MILPPCASSPISCHRRARPRLPVGRFLGFSLKFLPSFGKADKVLDCLQWQFIKFALRDRDHTLLGEHVQLHVRYQQRRDGNNSPSHCKFFAFSTSSARPLRLWRAASIPVSLRILSTRTSSVKRNHPSGRADGMLHSTKIIFASSFWYTNGENPSLIPCLFWNATTASSRASSLNLRVIGRYLTFTNSPSCSKVTSFAVGVTTNFCCL